MNCCEAQGKGRAKGRPRKVIKRSFIDMDGGWWLVVYLSLMLYTKFGCHHHHHPPSFHRTSLNLHDLAQYGPGEVGRGEEVCRVNMGHPRVTVGHCRSL